MKDFNGAKSDFLKTLDLKQQHNTAKKGLADCKLVLKDYTGAFKDYDLIMIVIQTIFKVEELQNFICNIITERLKI